MASSESASADKSTASNEVACTPRRPAPRTSAKVRRGRKSSLPAYLWNEQAYLREFGHFTK